MAGVREGCVRRLGAKGGGRRSCEGLSAESSAPSW